VQVHCGTMGKWLVALLLAGLCAPLSESFLVRARIVSNQQVVAQKVSKPACGWHSRQGSSSRAQIKAPPTPKCPPSSKTWVYRPLYCGRRRLSRSHVTRPPFQ
jgi:hypothetical protein